tara:strand:- start:8 stop:145 length:138 start_codon:yes stop_codon:yes gene_type:complete
VEEDISQQTHLVVEPQDQAAGALDIILVEMEQTALEEAAVVLETT